MNRLSQLDSATQNPIARKLTSSLKFLFIPFLFSRTFLKRVGICAFLTAKVAILCCSCVAQSSLPFEVSNPKHKKWPVDEAGRIYSSACELVARTIRPEKPPHLHPRFVLILGAQDNEMVRDGAVSEIHLKIWNSARFAEAVVLLATREVLKNEDVADIVRYAVISARASASVRDLRQER